MGEEKGHALFQCYYREADGVIFVFDVNDPKTLSSVDSTWIKKAYTYIPEDSFKKILVGHKAGEAGGRKVTFQQGKELADRHEMTYLEASAKQDIGIDFLFNFLSDELIDDPPKNENSRSTIKLGETPTYNRKTPVGCCNNLNVNITLKNNDTKIV